MATIQAQTPDPDKHDHEVDPTIEIEESEFQGRELKEEQRTHTVGDVVIISGSDRVRRVPIPSDDPNDPLHFPQWRKLGIIFTCCWFSNFSLLALSGIGTFFNSLFQIYSSEHAPQEVVGLATYSSMVMAFGSLGMLPLAIVFGRRPVFLFAILLTVASSISAALSQNFDAHFISRIFLGLGTGATESLLPLIIADVTFLDERSFYFGLYWASQNVVSTAVTVGLSYVTAALSWRWFYWIFVITLSVGVISVLVLNPETKFLRSPTAINGQVVFTDEFGTTMIVSDEEAAERFGAVEEHTSSPVAKKTFWQTLKPYNELSPNGLQTWLAVYGKILKSCTSPGVIFATLAASISLGIGIAVTLVYSTLLIDSFHWEPKSVGLFNAPIIPASFLAMFYSGYVADKTNIWLARRNHGVHKPEHHLLHLIIPCITGAIGITAMGVTADNPEKYSVWGLILGWGIYQFSFVCILINTTCFAAEVVPTSPGAAMVIVVGGKNIISFGASYGLIPMLQIYSYLQAFMILLGVYLGIFALGIPVYFLNNKWKKWAQ